MVDDVLELVGQAKPLATGGVVAIDQDHPTPVSQAPAGARRQVADPDVAHPHARQAADDLLWNRRSSDPVVAEQPRGLAFGSASACHDGLFLACCSSASSSANRRSASASAAAGRWRNVARRYGVGASSQLGRKCPTRARRQALVPARLSMPKIGPIPALHHHTSLRA